MSAASLLSSPRPAVEIASRDIRVDDLKIQIFADGADKEGIKALCADPLIKGFTTNPTLMRQAGVTDYAAFAKEILREVPDRSISFEVFSDEFDEMERQALEIASWGRQVYVKIPITNTRGESSLPLIRRLAGKGVKQNVTAMMTVRQTEDAVDALAGGPPSYLSIFAGRIADTGRDPLPTMQYALALMRPHANLELIWASPREILNVVQADRIGCHIITVTHSLLKKLSAIGRDLDDFSLATVQMFSDDATAAGYSM